VSKRIEISPENKRKLLVLDLDETLIHTSYAPILGAELKAKRGYFYLYERPYLKEFLDHYSAVYDLAIWSASKADYVRWIIRSTVLSNYAFAFVNTRKNCKRIMSNGGRVEYQKDLTPYLSLYEIVIILDDIPKMVVPIECCIKVPEYKGGWDNYLLIELLF
jgi:RNA polymerase II subunit A small phosphatase-like protein